MVIGMALLALLLCGVLMVCRWGYRQTFYSPNQTQNDDRAVNCSEQMRPYREEVLRQIDALNALPFERIGIASRDGLTLSGRYYHTTSGAPLVIGMHGYRGTPSRDFCACAQIVLREGCNLLLAEQRAHCGSGGHTITFGVRERYDCLDWVHYAVSRFGPETRVLLMGDSMGAATVLMASGLELPENVRGIAADCPFTSPLAIIRKVGRDRGMPPRLVGAIAVLSARLFGHFDLTAADAAEAVRASRVPILLLHGEADDYVPCDMSREICAAHPEKVALHTFPGAGHCLSYFSDPSRYERLLTGFIRDVLN